MIVLGSVVLNRACVDNEGCFDDMSGIHILLSCDSIV